MSAGRPRLPEAEAEEEIEESPLVARFQLEQQEQSLGRHSVKKDTPHLVFDITSDDGFHFQSDSLNSLYHFHFFHFLSTLCRNSVFHTNMIYNRNC